MRSEKTLQQNQLPTFLGLGVENLVFEGAIFGDWEEEGRNVKNKSLIDWGLAGDGECWVHLQSHFPYFRATGPCFTWV